MARSAQRRNRQRAERRPMPRTAAPIARPAQSYEDTMFFPRLRRQAKWMFVFLAVVFGLGYVIFNVGGTIPGVGLGDALQNIEDQPNNPTGYLELATALQRNGKNDEAIAPLERYISFRPRDRAALGQLAGIYLTQARGAQEEAVRAQAELTQLTGGDVFSPDPSSPFGKQFGAGQITQIEADKFTQRLNENYITAQQAFQNATSTYQKLIAAIPGAEEADQT